MKSRVLFWLSEIIVIISVGALPVTIAYLKGGITEMDKAIRSIIPGDLIIWLPLPFLLGFLIFSAIGTRFFRKNEPQRTISSSIFYILCEISSGAVSLLRALAGLLIAIPVIWIVFEPNDFSLSKASFFIKYGLIAVAESISLQYVMLATKSKFRPMEFEFSNRNLG